MRAAAAFAAAYGFPPSACRDAEEAAGLLRNLDFALAIRSVTVASGAGAVIAPKAGADLAERLGASQADVAAMHLEAMKQDAKRMRTGGGQLW